MAVLNVRLDDDIYERLKELADAEGASLSEFVRDLLLELVVPVSIEHGDEPAPESFSTRDRLMLSLLHRILARVLPKDANGDDGDMDYQLQKAQIIESGFTGEYWFEVAGFETELSKQDCRRVSDILEMFRIITYSVPRLEDQGEKLDKGLLYGLRFRGFDHNDTLEGHMARYVRYQMRDEDRWEELQPQVAESDNGNSHMKTLDTYMRMLTEFRKIMKTRERRFDRDAYFLSADELRAISAAAVHPSNRA
ncbi:YfbU family protein [Microbacterium profundi]|uniref:YfbU family protein n=1 Tax=Microbacterium profundi TaxID=450380 RepID=A0ABV3LID0_9MICO|nr:YfbU family protein [Microbacterium profundi]MCE7483743.1 YfbU family protein [Microbacterium profundi]